MQQGVHRQALQVYTICRTAGGAERESQRNPKMNLPERFCQSLNEAGCRNVVSMREHESQSSVCEFA